MANGEPYITDSARGDLRELRQLLSRRVFKDILQDITDLAYRVIKHGAREILGSNPKSWTVEICHGYVIAYSYSTEPMMAGMWVQLVVHKNELAEKLRDITIDDE